MNLTPWDVESKQIHTIDDTITAIYCGACRWGGSEKYIFYDKKDLEAYKDIGSGDSFRAEQQRLQRSDDSCPIRV